MRRHSDDRYRGEPDAPFTLCAVLVMPIRSLNLCVAVELGAQSGTAAASEPRQAQPGAAASTAPPQPPRPATRPVARPPPHRLNSAAAARGCACAASSASGWKASTAAASRTTATSYWLDRFRLNATVDRRQRSLSFVVQVQDARVVRQEDRRLGAPFRDTLDLRMAFAEVGGARHIGPRRPAGAGVRRAAPRRPPELAQHRAHVRRRTRDVRSARPFKVDAFATSVVTIRADEFDKSGNGNRFSGAYASTTTLDAEGSGRAVSLLAAVDGT